MTPDLEPLNAAVEAQRPEPKRDRWGRYIIPHPDTGKPHTWTRATTFAKTLSDTFALTKWELRMAALGFARRADLVAQAATVTDPDDGDAKRLLDTLAGDAKEAAGASTRRNLGTALHRMTEHLDAGRPFAVPDAHRADLDAYQAATTDLHIDPDHIERIVTVPDLDVAGTFDRLVTIDGTLMVADLKTGRDLSYAFGEIAVQLALYAHAATLWDQATETHEPMPTVDLERALVIHLPVGQARCDLYLVDIAAGWEMTATCATVRDWRKRKDLAAPLAVEQSAPAAATAERQTWIRQRITAIGGAGGEAREWLGRLWPDGVPTPRNVPDGGWTDPQIDQLADALSSVEQHARIPFHDGDPARATPAAPAPAPIGPPAAPDRNPGPDGRRVGAAKIAAARAALAALPDTEQHRLKVWATEAKGQGRPWATADMTARLHAISCAAIACARHLAAHDNNDDLTRAALAEAIGEDVHPAWLTGAVLGSLTTAEASQLERIAVGFADNDDQIVARLGERLAATPAA